MVLYATPLLYAQENPENATYYKSFYKTNIDLVSGTENWAKNIASIVYSEDIPEEEKTFSFLVSKRENMLLVNNELTMKEEDDSVDMAQNCTTLEKTCRSENCVKNVLIEILGEGNRNVLIKYERKMLAVKIYYTYQDCK